MSKSELNHSPEEEGENLIAKAIRNGDLPPGYVSPSAESDRLFNRWVCRIDSDGRTELESYIDWYETLSDELFVAVEAHDVRCRIERRCVRSDVIRDLGFAFRRPAPKDYS
jgi:hypothetical protein